MAIILYKEINMYATYCILSEENLHFTYLCTTVIEVFPWLENGRVFNVGRVIQFTLDRGFTCFFNIVTDTFVFHEAKRPTEVSLDDVNGSYHVIYQSLAVESASRSKFQLTTRVLEK